MYRLAFCSQIRSLHYYDGVIGAKVLNPSDFKAIVAARVPGFLENTKPDEDGEWSIDLKADVLPLLSSGMGRRSNDLEDYVVRKFRGRVGLYLKREFAMAPRRCEVGVVTKETYVTEHRYHMQQDGLTDAELENVTHVVVSVRIFAGPDTARTPTKPHSFIAKLSNAVGKPDKQDALSVIDLCNEAWNIDNYWRTFCEVAD